MGETLAQKIIRAHLLHGDMTPGSEIALRIDQTLTQDATGTMAYLEFETMGIPRVKTELSVAYVDHNTLQSGFENADDHRYLQTVAKKHGVWFSRPGNGICTTVQLERFGKPGRTLIGSDSHTPTGGGIGMLPSARGAWTSRSPWAAARTTSRCRKCSRSTSPARCALRHGQRHQPRAAAHPVGQGRRRRDHRVGRAGYRGAVRARARHDHEHGHRARRDDVHLPVGRRDARLPRRRRGAEADLSPLRATRTRA